MTRAIGEIGEWTSVCLYYSHSLMAYLSHLVHSLETFICPLDHEGEGSFTSFLLICPP